MNNSSALCPRGHTIAWSYSESLTTEGKWNECPACESPDAYVRKDVPPKKFLVLLATSLLVAFFLLGRNWFLGMGLLVALALLDWVLFRSLPDVLVCYRCESQVRGFTSSPDLEPFDHHRGERYRQIKSAQLD